MGHPAIIFPTSWDGEQDKSGAVRITRDFSPGTSFDRPAEVVSDAYYGIDTTLGDEKACSHCRVGITVLRTSEVVVECPVADFNCAITVSEVVVRSLTASHQQQSNIS